MNILGLINQLIGIKTLRLTMLYIEIINFNIFLEHHHPPNYFTPNMYNNIKKR